MKLTCTECDSVFQKGDFVKLTFTNEQLLCLKNNCSGHLVRLGINNEYHWFVKNLFDEKRFSANIIHSLDPKSREERISLTFKHIDVLPSMPNGFEKNTSMPQHVFSIIKTYSMDLTLFEREKILLQTMIDLIDWAVALP